MIPQIPISLRACALIAAGILALPLAVPVSPAAAQSGPPPMPGDQAQQGDNVDPPARVGRLSYISGTVSFRTLDEDQWESAVVNYPVTEGLSFWTEPDSRAALQLGHAVVRLDGSTELDVQQFNDQVVQINVPQGSVNFRLRRLDPDESYQVSTPSGTVALTAPGRYRVDAGANGGPAGITIFRGNAQPVGDNFGMMISSGPQAQPQDIDSWSDQQEAQFAPPPSYVSEEMPGVDDLAGQGNWDRSDYGQIWYPPVEAGWAPYRYGHWAFVPPWGWTWVDDAPWGFAPFHYGRWVEFHGRWGWIPGERIERPVYAPALVAFVGGGGLSVGIGIGGGSAVGWVPLGPREVYVPPYGGSIEYVRRVNRTSVTNVNNITINNITVNRTTTNFVNASAATVVRSDAMTRSEHIGNAAVKLPPTALQNATVVNQAPVKPTLATAGAGPSVVKALGGNVTEEKKQNRAPGPKVEAKPLPATVVKPLVTSPGTGTGAGAPGSKVTTPTAGAGTGTNPNATTNQNQNQNTNTFNKGAGAPGPNNRVAPAAGPGTGTNPNETTNQNQNQNTNTFNKGAGAPGPNNRFAPATGPGTGTNPNATTNQNQNQNQNTNTFNKGSGAPGPNNRFAPAAGPGTGTNPNATTNQNQNQNTNTFNKGAGAPGPNNRFAPTTGPGTGTNPNETTNRNQNQNQNTNTSNKGAGAPGPNNRFTPNANPNANVNTNTNANTNAGKPPPPPQEGGNKNANDKTKCDPKVQRCPP